MVNWYILFIEKEVIFLKIKIILILVIIILLTGCSDLCSSDLIESVKSPNGKYTIKTYLGNCGATTDFDIIGMLCDSKNDCKKIYYCYHESYSFVYWIDNENVFINQKKLNIYKDKYDNYDYENAFRLTKNVDYYKEMYLINNDNYEYRLDGLEADYIDEFSKSMFKFNKKNIFDNYDFIFKIVELESNEITQYYLKIENKDMYVINNDKMSKLNRTDYEYLKKILTSNRLYNFN